MVISRVFNWTAFAGVCFFVFATGCAQPQRAGIALKPAPGRQDSYRVSTYARRNIKWQGSVPKKQAFEESSTEEKVELGLTQNIQSVAADGKTTAKVTIDSLKYLSVIKNHTNIDFDNSRESDASSPLAKLIGQSYTIQFDPDNSVSSVLDLEQVQSLLKGGTAADRAAQNVISPEAIIERHSAILLPEMGKESLGPKGTWNRIKTFSFGMMGTKSYEKVYKVREIRDVGGHKIATVDMNAIPTSETEKGFTGAPPQSKTDFPKMFDTEDKYSGSGEVDLTAGSVVAYRENLQANWVTAFPPDTKTTGDANEPVVLLMTATRDYAIEKIK